MPDLPSVDPAEIVRTGDPSPVRNIFAFAIRMGGRHQFAVCLLALAIAALAVAPIDLQRRIINEAVEAGDLTLLGWLAAVYLVVMLSRRALKFALGVYQRWLSESAALYCRGHLSELARAQVPDERAGRNAHESTKTEGMGRNRNEGAGRRVAVIVQEIGKVSEFVGTGLSKPLTLAAELILVLGYMLATAPVVAAVAFTFFVPQFALAPLLQARLNRLMAEGTDLRRQLSDALVDFNLESRKSDSSSNPNEDGVAREQELRVRIFRNRMKLEIYKQALKFAIGLLNALAPLSVLVFGGYLVTQGQTTIGVIVAFMTGFERLANPVRELIAYYRMTSLLDQQHTMIADWMTAAVKVQRQRTKKQRA